MSNLSFSRIDEIEPVQFHLKDEIESWWKEYQFDAFISLSIDNQWLNVPSINRKLIRWVRKIQEIEKIQIAYMGVISKHRGHSRKHIHLLMVAKNRYGKLLKNCDLDNFKKSWDSCANIQFIYNYEGIVRYLCYKNMGCTYELITPYNMKLLKAISVNHKQKDQLFH